MSLAVALVGGVASAWLAVLARRDRRWYWYVAGVAAVVGTNVVIEMTRGSGGSASVLVYLAIVAIGMFFDPKTRHSSRRVDRDEG